MGHPAAFFHEHHVCPEHALATPGLHELLSERRSELSVRFRFDRLFNVGRSRKPSDDGQGIEVRLADRVKLV
jgi:hypothetical protein